MPDDAERATNFWGVFVRMESRDEAAQQHTDVPKHTHTDRLPVKSILRKVRAPKLPNSIHDPEMNGYLYFAHPKP